MKYFCFRYSSLARCWRRSCYFLSNTGVVELLTGIAGATRLQRASASLLWNRREVILHEECYVIKRVCFGALAALLLLVVPSGIRAEGTSCGEETVIVPDGRVTQSTIPGSTTFWFLFNATPGHSYSIEFKNAVAQWGTSPGTMSVYYTNVCSTADTTTNTTTVDPAIFSTANRVSFTEPTNTNANQVRMQIVNSSTTSYPYTFSVSDTTLFSPRWSTFSGFTTFYGFENTTSAAISVKLTLTDIASTVVATSTQSVPAGQIVYLTTGQLGVANNDAGSAILSHNGPPGAILADCILGNFTVSPPTSMVGKFEERHSTH